MKYRLPKQNLDIKKYDDMSVTLGNEHPSYSTVKNWIPMFRVGCLRTENERSERTTEVQIPKTWMSFFVPWSQMIAEHLLKRQQ
jgi:hypothetical protein